MDDRRRDGGTNSTLRTKEQGTNLTLNDHDDDDDELAVETLQNLLYCVVKYITQLHVSALLLGHLQVVYA